MKGQLKDYLAIVIFSVIFGITYSLARCLERENQIHISFLSALIAGLLCVGVLIGFYRFISSEKNFSTKKENVNIKSLWLIILGILLISYFLCLLVYFPGVGMNDGLNIMYWKTDTFNQFPAFYAMFIIALTQLGYWLGNLQFTIGFYSVCQVIAVAMLSSWLIVWFWRKPVSKVIKFIVFLYYVAEPLLAMYAISMLKDTLFSLLLTVLMILTYEMVHQDVWFRTKWFWGALTATLLGIIFLRNNGSYLVIPFLFILFMVLKKFRRKLLMVSTVTLFGIVISTFPVKVVGGESLFQEKAGIPLQQIASVVANDGEYSEEQADFIDHLMPLNEIKARYNPSTVDPIKWNNELFDHGYLNNHAKEFLITWAEMLPANFATYVKAYLQQTFYFWAPLQKGRVQCFYSIETYADNTWLTDFAKENGIHDQPLLPGPFNNMLRTYYKTADHYLREGILFWIMMGSALLMVLKRGNKKEILPFLPGIFLWLTIMISTPVSSSLRYILTYVYSLPFYIGFLFLKENQSEEALEENGIQKIYHVRASDIALFISVMCIVIGHIAPWGTPLRNLMFSFQMPLLFIVVGYQMKKIDSVSELLDQIRVDFKYLMVPYIAFHIAASILGLMMRGEVVNLSIWTEELLWASGVEYQGHPPVGAIWILNVLFWAKTLYSVIQLKLPKRFYGIACGILACVGYSLGKQELWLILSLDVVMVVIFYLYLGSQMRKWLEWFAKSRFLILVPFGIWILLWKGGLYIEFAARHYPMFPLVVLQSLCGAICIILLSKRMEKCFETHDSDWEFEKRMAIVLGLHHLSWNFPWLWGYGVFDDCLYNLVFLILLTAAIVFAGKWLIKPKRIKSGLRKSL